MTGGAGVGVAVVSKMHAYGNLGWVCVRAGVPLLMGTPCPAAT